MEVAAPTPQRASANQLMPRSSDEIINLRNESRSPPHRTSTKAPPKKEDSVHSGSEDDESASSIHNRAQSPVITVSETKEPTEKKKPIRKSHDGLVHHKASKKEGTPRPKVKSPGKKTRSPSSDEDGVPASRERRHKERDRDGDSRKPKRPHERKSSKHVAKHSSSSDEEDPPRSSRRREKRQQDRGSSRERKSLGNTIRRSPHSTPNESTPPNEVLSPKEEEIGRMHKEIETLKNLTKILEEKLEILEHNPDSEAASGTSSGRRLATSSSSHAIVGSTGSNKHSDTSDDESATRVKIKPRHAASTPAFLEPKRGHVKPEISQSTSELTKLRRRKLQERQRSGRRSRSSDESEVEDEVVKESSDSDSDDESSASGDRSDNEDANDGEGRRLRKSVSLTELRDLAANKTGEGEVAKIKKEHDMERKVNKKRARRERARGRREAERREQNETSDSHSDARLRTKSVPYVSPYGNTPATKSLECCYSCLMKTDITTTGDRKLWKRRVLGLGTNGLNLIKPYTEVVERVWLWPTIQQWIINDEQNLIKFMIEEEMHDDHNHHHHHHSHPHSHHNHHHGGSSGSDGDSGDEKEHHGEGTQCESAIYTFRVDDVNKVNDALWKVVKQVQKKRRVGLDRLGGSHRSSAQSSARNSDDERSSSGDEHHTHFKESVQSLFKALTHSLGHGKDKEKERDHAKDKDKEKEKDKDHHKERK